MAPTFIFNPNDDRIQFLLWVGMALESWQKIELDIARLFDSLLETPDDRRGVVLLGVLTFSLKLRATDALLRFVIDDKKLIERWRRLSAKIASAEKERNNLVHWFPTYGPETAPGEKRQRVLARSILDPRNKKSPKGGEVSWKHSWDRDKILKVGRNFDVLHDQISTLWLEILAFRASPKKSQRE